MQALGGWGADVPPTHPAPAATPAIKAVQATVPAKYLSPGLAFGLVLRLCLFRLTTSPPFYAQRTRGTHHRLSQSRDKSNYDTRTPA
jgi:hypothetical protein